MRLSRQPRLLFLIDGVGALFSAILMAVVVLPLQNFFGMPGSIVKGLAIVAFLLAGYSLSCYMFYPANPRRYLVFIALANMIYCLVTSMLLVRNSTTITGLGFTYFLGEMAIMIIILCIEWLAVIQKNRTV